MNLIMVALVLTSADDKVWVRLSDGTVAYGSIDLQKISFKTEGGTLSIPINEFFFIKKVKDDFVLARDKFIIVGQLVDEKISIKTDYGTLAIEPKDILMIRPNHLKDGSKILFFDDYWDDDDLIVATNDKITGLKTGGDVVHVQLNGMGESSLVKKNRYNFEFPIEISFKISRGSVKIFYVMRSIPSY